jgi:dienelactone hydrolase
MKKKPRIFVLILLAFAVGCASAGAAMPRPAGTWSGTLSLPSASDPVGVSIELRGGRAIVALGAGLPARTEVAARATPGRLRLSLPGRPAPLVLDVRARGARLIGSIRQGTARGTVELRRGRALEASTAGLFSLGEGRFLAAVDGPGQRTALLLDAGKVHLLTPGRPGAYAVGSGLSTPSPSRGQATFSAGGATWLGARAERVPLRQVAVRVGVLACTLTIPPGTGRRTAVAFAHGGGPALRTFVAFQAAHLQRLGLITLACDKRGIGQSGGRYPGDLASSPTIDVLARDVEAQARFLAAQSEVDPSRVGVMGGSQAGWIMPLAASREPAIRFMLGLVPPTVTQGETDLFAQLSGQGQSPPTRTEPEVLAEVRAAGPSGFDPLPSIRALRIPALWLFGGVDKVVPTRLCIERLDPVAREPGRDFTYAVFPGGGHGLIQTANGLLTEQDRSDRFVPGLHTTIADWLRARGIA